MWYFPAPPQPPPSTPLPLHTNDKATNLGKVFMFCFSKKLANQKICVSEIQE